MLKRIIGQTGLLHGHSRENGGPAARKALKEGRAREFRPTNNQQLCQTFTPVIKGTLQQAVPYTRPC